MPKKSFAFLAIIAVVAGVWVARHFRKRVKVTLDYGSFIGKVEPFHDLEWFYAIPFAEPPLGNLRFNNPIKPTKKYWNHDCTKHGHPCTQQSIAGNASMEPYKSWLRGAYVPLEHIKTFGPGKEDCLTLDITRPKGVTSSSRLPVMFFIFPGGFTSGASWNYSPKSIVKKSINMGLPIIHVSSNYRLNAFGFLGGREVGQAGVGNLGLKDQRLTMEWIKTYISEFGGDPDKVTIYGESSGAMSVSHHILAFHGQHNGLFRAAIAQSGTALPTGKLSEGTGQEAFDHLAKSVGCESAADKLECMRGAPYEKIQKTLNDFPGLFSFGAFPLMFGPAVDGEFVTEPSQKSLKAGRFAKVPVITGNMFDEGTLLAISTLPLHTDEDLKKFMSEKFGPGTAKHMDEILQLWPSDPNAGSPFASGSKYALTPVYKQYSAILGDCPFQGTRRLFLNATSESMPTWSYIDQAERHLPIIGAYHGSDLPAVFGQIPGGRREEYQTRWIAFANNMDPNYPGLSHWPTYEKGKLNLIIDKNGSIGLEADTFRKTAIDFYLANVDDLAFGSH